jgi:hypothetical protein
MIGFPKPRPARLEREDRKKTRVTADETESKKVKLRSGGRCEVVVQGEGRCRRRAHSVHHMIGGIGVRGRGVSALAERKQHVCDGPTGHHGLITDHVLQRVPTGTLPHYTDTYVRVG